MFLGVAVIIPCEIFPSADANAYHQFLSAALPAAPFGAAALLLRRGGPTDAGLGLGLA